jgi:hypothetical protein
MGERRADYHPFERGHEPPEPPMKPVAWFGLGFVVLILASVVLSVWLTSAASEEPPRPAEPRIPIDPLSYQRGPGPQVNPRGELEQLRQIQTRRLNSYGWVDRDRGVVHIPIDRAIDLALERGLQVAPAGPDATEEAP